MLSIKCVENNEKKGFSISLNPEICNRRFRWFFLKDCSLIHFEFVTRNLTFETETETETDSERTNLRIYNEKKTRYLFP